MRKGANRQSGRTGKDSGLNARYAKYKEVLKDLTIMSDIFMRNVFKKKECTEYVLRVIMQNEDLQVLDQLLQKDFKNLLGRLMHDFHCKSAGDIYSKVLARRVYELKETQKGVQHMCREMDKIYSEGERHGEMRGERRGRKQMISNYIKVCQREGVLPEQLKVQLVKYFNLTAGQAERYVGRSDFPQAGSETGGYGAARV